MSVRITRSADDTFMVLDEYEVFKGEVRFHEGRGAFCFVNGDTTLDIDDLRELAHFLANMPEGPKLETRAPKPAELEVDFGNGPL